MTTRICPVPFCHRRLAHHKNPDGEEQASGVELVIQSRLEVGDGAGDGQCKGSRNGGFAVSVRHAVLVEYNADGVVQHALAKDERIQGVVDAEVAKDGQHRHGVGSRHEGAK